MTTYTLLSEPEQQYIDENGNPYAGGKVYFYIPNTDTAKNTYQDSAGTILNTNPVILDSAGRAIIYGTGQYREVLYDANDNLVYDQLTSDLLYLFNIPATTRVRLSANATYYVATTGNDTTGNGTSASPWLTIQHALNYVHENLDLNDYSVTVSVADGTYAGAVSLSGPFVGGSTVILLGNTTTPTNCIINVTSSAAIAMSYGADLQIEGFKVLTTSSGSGLFASYGSVITLIGAMNFGSTNGDSHIQAYNGGIVQASGISYTISGGANFHWNASLGGQIYFISCTITLSGTPAFSGSFALASCVSYVNVPSNTFSGSATGQRYQATLDAAISTNGAGATYLPGNSNGTVSKGGVYDSTTSYLLSASNLSDLASLATALTNLGFGGSAGVSGYFPVPNPADTSHPYIVQWAKFTYAGATQAVTWPTAFNSAAYVAFPVLGDVGDGNTHTLSYETLTTTGCNFFIENGPTGSGAASFMVIGK